MRLIQTFKAFRALTPEQRELLKEKIVEGERTSGDWLELLSAPAAYDGLADKVRGQARTLLFIVPVVGFFAGMFGSAVLGGSEPSLLVAVVLAAVVAAPLAVIFFATRSADLADQMRRVALPFLALVGDDVEPGRPVRLSMDLRGGTEKSKLREELPTYSKAGRTIRERIYEDPWMNGSATLADRSRLHWRLTDEVHQLRISKRNARGKTKTKTKYKVRSLIDLTLELPVAAYRSRADAAGSNLRLRVSEGDKWIKLRGRRVTVQKGLDPLPPPLEQVLRTVTDLHAQVEPVATRGA